MITEPEAEIRRLIASEQFEEAGNHLRRYTVEAQGNPEALGKAVGFLRELLLTVRARRAHYSSELNELSAARSYVCGSADDLQALDFSG